MMGIQFVLQFRRGVPVFSVLESPQRPLGCACQCDGQQEAEQGANQDVLRERLLLCLFEPEDGLRGYEESNSDSRSKL